MAFLMFCSKLFALRPSAEAVIFDDELFPCFFDGFNISWVILGLIEI
jgi:hypothetical protein